MLLDPEPLQASTTDPEELQHAAHRVKEHERQAHDDLRQELSTEAGRRRLWARLAPVFAPIGGPPEQVYRALGRRDQALDELHAASRHGELFVQLWVEGLKRQRAERSVRQAHKTRRATPATSSKE